MTTIKSKLVIGVTLLIALPMMITRYLFHNKSYAARIGLLMQTAEETAKDLADRGIKSMSKNSSPHPAMDIAPIANALYTKAIQDNIPINLKSLKNPFKDFVAYGYEFYFKSPQIFNS